MSLTIIGGHKPSLLLIRSNLDKVILEITQDGEIYININNDLKKISDIKDVAYAFALSIAEMNGIIHFNTDTEDEIINKIVSFYRDKQINKIST